MLPPFNCKHCVVRDKCTELCEPARRYADQDYRANLGINVPTIFFQPDSTIIPPESDGFEYGNLFDFRELAVLILLNAGFNRMTVRKLMHISNKRLCNIISSIRKKWEILTQKRSLMKETSQNGEY